MTAFSPPRTVYTTMTTPMIRHRKGHHVHARRGPFDHGAGHELGSGQDLPAGEAQVSEGGDDGRHHGNPRSVAETEEVGIGHHPLLDVHLLDAGDQEDGGHPRTDQAREQEPASREAHGVPQPTQPDGEPSSNVRGSDG